MKTFFKEWGMSLTDGGWYKDIFEGKIPLKLRYALGLSFIGAIVLSTSFGFVLYGELIPDFKSFVKENISDDLVVEVKSGELSINRPVPYYISLSESEKVSGKDNFLVIDTDAQATLESPSVYKTLIFSSKTMFVTEKENGEIRAYSLKDFPNFTFTKEKALSYVNTALSYAWILLILVLLAVTMFGFFQILLVSLFSAFLLWIISKIARRKAMFKSIYTATLYAYTVVFSFNLVLSVFSMQTFKFLLSAIITVLVAVFFIFLSKKEESKTPDQNIMV